MDQEIMDTAAAARYLAISQAFLVKLRWTGNGPAFSKLGRSVRYQKQSLDSWLAKNERSSTHSDHGPQAA